MSKPKITQKQARANEQAVRRVYPKATYFGVDAKKNFPHPEQCVCQVYESEDFNAKVIGDGDTYEEAWADVLKRLIPVERHPHRDYMVDDGFCLKCQHVHSFFVET
jgi:hypothetical protein